MTSQQQDIWNQVSKSMIDKCIDNKYQLVEELGRGSYGCLFLGQSLETNAYVAVKILCKKGLDPTQLALQQLEIDIQQSLQHAHLLGLDQVIQEPDFVYMIMELCDQGDLFEYVVQNQPYDVNCHVIFLQILEAVEYMHQHSLYHRDIKLENILLQKQDTIKVADFGLATRERYSYDFGCGSTTYLGPEHFTTEDESDMQQQPYDAAASDIWSLGILLLALLFGRNPWQEATDLDAAFSDYRKDPNSLRRLFPDLSVECMQFLHQVLAIDPSKRVSIGDMKAMFCELTEFTVDVSSDYESSEEEDQDEQEIMTSPVDIRTIQHKANKASYDSAIFSQEDGVGGGSWADMVEQDILCGIEDDFEHITFDSTTEEDDEQELFIHDQEKESWWL